MKGKTIQVLVVILIFSFGCKDAVNEKEQDAYKTELVEYKTYQGTSFNGELGYVNLKENREDSLSKSIQVPFFRIKTTAKNYLPPIFVLAGGPGDSPSILEQINDIAPLLYEFSSRSDVVVIEQRGNGLSNPNLLCPNTYSLPLDEPLSFNLFAETYRNYIQTCSNYWQEKNRDLSGYNVISMADDIDDIRKTLGYNKIMLFGGSFGSHHALVYTKQYPNNVDRILLDSPEGLTHTVKLPVNADKILNQLSDLVSKNKNLNHQLPSFKELVKNQLKLLESTPIKVEVLHPETNKQVDIVLGKYDLQLITALELGRKGYRELPFHYLQMEQGNYTWLAKKAINIRVNQQENIMAVLTDCASGATKERWDLVNTQKFEAILEDALNNVIFSACDLIPNKELANSLAEDFKSNIPILLIYGSQDARTPPENAYDIAGYFNKTKMLKVKYGSHDLFKEVLDSIKPIMINYLASEYPEDLIIPKEINAKLDLKTEE